MPCQKIVILGVLACLGFAHSARAATITVGAGGDFQAAVNQANPGDTIILQAGAAYPTSGGFTLPNKGSSTQVITIQSSALTSLPSAGYRIHPSDASNMPKLVETVQSGSPILTATGGAHHYQFVGIEFTEASGIWSNELVALGDATETSLAQMPHDITIDRCYIHGDPVAGSKRGVQFAGINLTLMNSYVSEIHALGQDSQAVAGWTAPGPFHVLNNYLEAAGENLLFGGDDPVVANVVPSDIEIRNNYLFKPLSWKSDDPSYAGNLWQEKNLLEMKNAQRVIIDGNVLENCWAQAQTGYAVLFTPRNQEGTAPWSVVRDITFTHNIVRHTGSGFQLLSTDDAALSQITQNLILQDNLIDDVNPTQFGGDGRIFQLTTPGATAQNYQLNHNTALFTGGGNSFATAGDCCTVANGFVFTNSIVTHGSYGFKAGGGGEGTAALNQYFTNWTMTKNAIIGGGTASVYPTGNFFPNALSDVGFVNPSGGDYHLAASSPYKNAGTDGKDLGADIDTLVAATCGTVQGIPTSACSTYVPPAPPPPPSSGSLPAPLLNLPPWLPVNAQISATEPSGYQIATYNWSILPGTAGLSMVSGTAAISQGGHVSFPTASGVANLAPLVLAPGNYQILVTATDSNGNTSPPAQANVTLGLTDLSASRVYPNPWRADKHAGIFVTFDQLTANTTIKIFTVSGHWVKTLPQTNNLVTWDLTNNSGDKVASGIYLYVITSDSGSQSRGKLVIIR